MNGFLLAIAFLFAAPGRIYALSRFQVPPPANTEKPAKAIPHPQTHQDRVVLEKVTAVARSRTVMPVVLEYLPYAQALQEGIPGITATPLPYDKNFMTLALVIPLAPEDLPVQSQKQKEDLRDALAPQSSYGQALTGTKHCKLRQAGQCPFSRIEPTPKGVKRCKSRYRLLWWTRILPVLAFDVLLQKLHFPLSKAPKLNLTLSASGGEGTEPAEGGRGAPSFADEIFSQ